jgi:hypothetical protein
MDAVTAGTTAPPREADALTAATAAKVMAYVVPSSGVVGSMVRQQ